MFKQNSINRWKNRFIFYQIIKGIVVLNLKKTNICPSLLTDIFIKHLKPHKPITEICVCERSLIQRRIQTEVSFKRFSTQAQNANSAGVQHKVKLRHGYLHHDQHKRFTILGSTCNSYHRTAEPVFAKRHKPFKFGRSFCCDLSCGPLTCGFRNFAYVAGICNPSFLYYKDL